MKFKAFLSYARVDNEIDCPISKLRDSLLLAVRQQSGIKDFDIFFDIKHIEPGEQWKERLNNTIKETHFLITILTPSYFNSENCNWEFDSFLIREKELIRNDLIIPILWRDIKGINNERITNVEQRHRVDFRAMRDKPPGAEGYKQLIEEIAGRILFVLNGYTTSYQEFDNIQMPSFKEEEEFIKSEGPLYAQRMNHFRKEKKFLCEKFCNLLIHKLSILSRTNDCIILFIDSGTTLFYIFSILGEFAAKHYSLRDHWINKVVIVTNNMTGIRLLSKIAVQKSNSRFVEPVIKCISLPGIAYPTYSAFLGFQFFHNETLQNSFDCFQSNKILFDFVENLKIKNLKTKMISLVTGSWIRIRETTPYIPLPLARGTGHIALKQAMVEVAEEIYIISTLGKIFAKGERNQVFKILDQFANDPSTPTHYDELLIETEDFSASHIKLVTTSRKKGDCILSNLAEVLENDKYMDVQRIDDSNFQRAMQNFCSLSYETVPNIMFEFEGISQDIQEQFKQEFPHESSRSNKEFISAFHLDDIYMNKFFDEK